MTLRDYFAAQALAGIVSNPFSHAGAAERAYLLADEMMKARQKPEGAKDGGTLIVSADVSVCFADWLEVRTS